MGHEPRGHPLRLRWRYLLRFPKGPDGSNCDLSGIIKAHLGTEVSFLAAMSATGGLSLPDGGQGHSLAPGQDEHVISSWCFPEQEGGVHLLLPGNPHTQLICQQRLALVCTQLREWGPGKEMILPAASQPQIEQWNLPAEGRGGSLLHTLGTPLLSLWC